MSQIISFRVDRTECTSNGTRMNKDKRDVQRIENSQQDDVLIRKLTIVRELVASLHPHRCHGCL